MGFSILFSNKNLILNVEVRSVILKVDVFRYDKSTHNFIMNLCDKTVVSGTWVEGAIIECISHITSLVKNRTQI